MRILFVVPSLGNGGAERVITNLANELTSLGDEIGILVYQLGGDYEKHLRPEVAVYKIGHDVKHWHQKLHALLCLKRVARGYDIIVSGLELFTDGLVYWLKKLSRRQHERRAYITVLHICLSEYHRFTRSRQRQSFVRKAYPTFDSVITVSKGVEGDLRSILGRPVQNITTIHNPIAVGDIQRKSRQRVDIAKCSPYFLAVGRIRHQKDYVTLVHAFKILQESRHDFHLVILGRGDVVRLQEQCATLGVGNVHFAGFTDNPWAYMAGAAALISSSVFEGFSLVIAEAMACGLPVISTDCPHGPSELLDNGNLGYLVPVRDPEALARTMEHVLDNPEEAQAKASDALESVARFDLAGVAGRYHDLFMASIEDRLPIDCEVPFAAEPDVRRSHR